MAQSLPSFPPTPKSTTILATPAQATISAPASQVYKLLTDTSTWMDWNPFVPKVTMLETSAASSSETPTNTLIQSGAKMTFHSLLTSSAKLPNTTDIHIRVKSMSYVSSEKCYQIIWIIESWYPYWLLNAERKQEIFETGPESCEYRSWEEMAGLLAYLLAYVNPGREMLKSRFRDWAEGLKFRAEEIWSEENAQRTTNRQ